jgi:ribA/ribD-fused uncharacterized protein
MQYIFFFGENNDFGWLSNFFPSKFVIDEITFNTNEHFFMWSKSNRFEPDNNDKKTKILMAQTPFQAKKIGRTVQNFDEKIWDIESYSFMVKGLLEKFKQNIDLKNKLIQTNNAILIEASPYDKKWGIGMNEDTAWTLDLKSFNEILKERNLLGKALMEVRSILKTI